MSNRKAQSIRALILAVASGSLALAAVPAQACSSDPYAGTVCFMAGTFCPENYVAANGATLKINDYQMLYALFGTTFGGDGRTTFGVPDLRGRAAVGTGKPFPANALSPGTVSLGIKLGAEAVALTQDQMPAHTHAATFTGQTSAVTIQPKFQVLAAAGTSMAPSAATPYLSGAANVGGATRRIWRASPGTPTANVSGLGLAVSAAPPSAGGASVTNDPAGGYSPTQTSAVPMISPEVIVTACVAYNGIFPTNP